MEYKPTIGLEIHAELKTKTKMFCSCKNDPDEKRPNTNICPVCMGHPGTLPVINKQAVRNVIKVGLAVGGNIAEKSEFDRKNYFYPDIPKGYQISQYKYPLVSNGELSGVKITRIHLEEDTAKSSHDKGEYSLVDFNRAGVPLMELVTEPVIHSAKDAGNFAKELQLLLQYLKVAEANMEKGEMRVEANISVSKTDKFGTKVEVKNLNSFKAVEKAIEYEFSRHIEILEKGQDIIQETRGWDDINQKTFSQRTKENSHDYRYFPDPDLPKLDLSENGFDLKQIKGDDFLTPNMKRNSLKELYGVKDTDIEFYIYNRNLSDLFESAATGLPKNYTQTLSNLIVSDVASLGERGLSINPKHLSELVSIFMEGEISSRGMKDILPKLSGGEKSPKSIAESEGLYQKSNKDELKEIVKVVIENNQNIASEYKSGKVSALQYLIGQGMKATKGSGNPQVLKDLFIEQLS